MPPRSECRTFPVGSRAPTGEAAKAPAPACPAPGPHAAVSRRARAPALHKRRREDHELHSSGTGTEWHFCKKLPRGRGGAAQLPPPAAERGPSRAAAPLRAQATHRPAPRVPTGMLPWQGDGSRYVYAEGTPGSVPRKPAQRCACSPGRGIPYTQSWFNWKRAIKPLWTTAIITVIRSSNLIL